VLAIWDIRTVRNEPPHLVARFQAHGSRSAARHQPQQQKGKVGAALTLNASTSAGPQVDRHVPAEEGQTSGLSVEAAAPGGQPSSHKTITLTASNFPPSPRPARADEGAGGVGGFSAIAAMLNHEPEILAITFAPSKQVVVTAGSNREIRVRRR
jgi:hypothetical protein